MRMQGVEVPHRLFVHIYLVRFCLYVAQEMGHGICMNRETIVIGHIHVPSRLDLMWDAQIHRGSDSLQSMMAR